MQEAHKTTQQTPYLNNIASLIDVFLDIREDAITKTKMVVTLFEYK